MNQSKFPPIFIISLKHSKRREFISERLTSLGLSFQFIDAVYGKDLSEEELSKIDFDFFIQKFKSKKKLTLGEIGCAMSHVNAYEKILANNLTDGAIILEDDAVVSPDFVEIATEALRKLPKKADILFFDHGKAKVSPFYRSLPEHYRLSRYLVPSKNSRRGIYKTTAYFITKLGCEKLLKNAYPIRMPSDYLTGFPQVWGTVLYGVEPPCVFGGAISEIDAQGQR